jgi:hypothetical protein
MSMAFEHNPALLEVANSCFGCNPFTDRLPLAMLK